MDTDPHVLEDTELNELDIFTEADLEKLHEYRLFTIGGLLGATQGLLKVEIFKQFHDPEGILSCLLQLVPGQLLQRYRDPDLSRPTGLLMRDVGDVDDE